MKKFLVTILAFIYLGVSSGIAMNIHYCMGKISAVDLMHNSDKCGKCGMKMGPGGCCKDEFKIIKLSDSHKLISNDVSISVPVAIVNNNFSLFNSDLAFTDLKAPLKNNSPPQSSGVSLNILHCIFRI